MKGFALAVALAVLAVVTLAQPILLEINTNFVAHKLQPQEAFISKVRVSVPKGIGNFSISKMRVGLKNPTKESYTFGMASIFTVPFKAFAVKISKIKPALFTIKMESPKTFAEKIPIKVALNFIFPAVKPLKTNAKFAFVNRTFKGVGIENINVSKNINVKIAWKRSKNMKTSLEILEMRKKVSAYSPLGGLETIGKYLEQNRYALWGNQEFIGMFMDTQTMSSWIAYNYLQSQLTNFSLSFNVGPFSPLFVMKEGNVRLDVKTMLGVDVGGTISATNASVFSYIPFTWGNFKAEIGGKYFFNSSPTMFCPKIMAGYTFGSLTPYVYYETMKKIHVSGVGITARNFNVNVSMETTATPTFNTVGRYFSRLGVLSLGFNWNALKQIGNVSFSSVPFGFNTVQFSADTALSMDSKGNYKVDIKLDTFFKFFFSYMTLWLKGEFTGEKPIISYGAEASF